MVVSYIRLRQDGVPYLEWHSGISRKEACNIAVSPKADDSFCDVGSLVIGLNIFDSDFGRIAEEGFEAF